MSRIKVLVEGPALTRSGYGEHTRLVLRSLRVREELFDIYLNPLNWGGTGWLSSVGEEIEWFNTLVSKFQNEAPKENKNYDVQIHVGIPNEFERKASYCVCVTAGIEATKVSPNWIQKSYEIDKIIVPSNFSKWVFENTFYDAQNEEGKQFRIGCGAAVDTVNYPFKEYSGPSLGLQLEHDFNFLNVAQWGTRKNLQNCINWFLDEFGKEEVGLIIKTNMSKNSTVDKWLCESKLRDLVHARPDKEELRASLLLLHGDMTDEEMDSLYKEEKIKAFITTTHGEGYGLPLFEAAYNELPIVAPGWSGHMDFLYAPVKDKKSNKIKNKPLFAKVDYTLKPIQKEAVWKDILVEDSMWCYPIERDFKRKIRKVHDQHGMYKSWAKKLASHIKSNFSLEATKKKMLNSLIPERMLFKAEYIFVNDLFVEDYTGGAELSLETLISSAPSNKTLKVRSSELNELILQNNPEAKWVFGNIANLSDEMIQHVVDSGIEYSFVEFDYKYCKHRNPALYEMVEGNACDYKNTEKAKLITSFINNAASVFYMSEKQKQIHLDHMPNINNDKLLVLSSLFDKAFFDTIERLSEKTKSKNNKWVVLGSRSWVKGLSQTESYCKEKEYDYEVLWNLKYEKFLEKLAESRGLCFKPTGLDTCPRMVIEAKVLGCEIDTNTLVQHAEEEWFKASTEETLEYLKTRPAYFWRESFSA